MFSSCGQQPASDSSAEVLAILTRPSAPCPGCIWLGPLLQKILGSFWSSCMGLGASKKVKPPSSPSPQGSLSGRGCQQPAVLSHSSLGVGGGGTRQKLQSLPFTSMWSPAGPWSTCLPFCGDPGGWRLGKEQVWKSHSFWTVSSESWGVPGRTLFYGLGTRRTGVQDVPGPLAAV